MNETISHFNTLYTVLSVIFAAGVCYATIKVSLKGMSKQVEVLTNKVEELERKLHELEIQKHVNSLRFENIQKTLDDINGKITLMSDFYSKIEKRGVLTWQQTEAPQ